MRLSFFVIVIFFPLATKSYAQDTTIVANDTIVTPTQLYSEKTLDEAELIEMKNRFNPRIAGLYSGAIPGLGQAYNKKYWKIPLVYGGFVGIGLTVRKYNKGYQVLRKELLETLAIDGFADGGLSPSGWSEEQIRNQVSRYRRERDYYIILGCVWYILNIADAHIDAHLSEFKVNEKLKLSVDPSVGATSRGMNGGLSLTLHFQ